MALPTLFTSLKNRGCLLDDVYEKKWQRQRLKQGEIEVYPDMFLEKTGGFVDTQALIAEAEIIEGIPFLTLEQLRMFKHTGREKDDQDIALIDEYLVRKRVSEKMR